MAEWPRPQASLQTKRQSWMAWSGGMPCGMLCESGINAFVCAPERVVLLRACVPSSCRIPAYAEGSPHCMFYICICTCTTCMTSTLCGPVFQHMNLYLTCIPACGVCVRTVRPVALCPAPAPPRSHRTLVLDPGGRGPLLSTAGRPPSTDRTGTGARWHLATPPTPAVPFSESASVVSTSKAGPEHCLWRVG